MQGISRFSRTRVNLSFMTRIKNLCNNSYVSNLLHYVGYIKLDIPWSSLFSASVVAHLEDVYILAGPITDRVYDPERERALQNAVKREMLESLETSAISKVGKKNFC